MGRFGRLPFLWLAAATAAVASTTKTTTVLASGTLRGNTGGATRSTQEEEEEQGARRMKLKTKLGQQLSGRFSLQPPSVSPSAAASGNNTTTPSPTPAPTTRSPTRAPRTRAPRTRSPTTVPTPRPSVVATPPPSNSPTTNGTVVGGRIDTCPDEFPGWVANCTGHVEGLMCEYDYIYTGCSYEELRCFPIAGCECSGDMIGVVGDAGSPSSSPPQWWCYSAAMMGCDPSTTPESLPWGKPCDPEASLPTAPPSSPDDVGGNDGEGRIATCPEQYPDDFSSCSAYERGLSCNYGYMYLGCSWNELSCSSVASCECDIFSGEWWCMAPLMEECPTKPDDLPWGLVCDPAVALPTPGARRAE
jgi:hypothetical protein